MRIELSVKDIAQHNVAYPFVTDNDRLAVSHDFNTSTVPGGIMRLLVQLVQRPQVISIQQIQDLVCYGPVLDVLLVFYKMILELWLALNPLLWSTYCVDNFHRCLAQDRHCGREGYTGR